MLTEELTRQYAAVLCRDVTKSGAGEVRVEFYLVGRRHNLFRAQILQQRYFRKRIATETRMKSGQTKTANAMILDSKPWHTPPSH